MPSFGWIKDNPDTRDFSARSLVYAAIPLPSSYRVDPYTVIYNQGAVPSCVGWSLAGVKTDQEYKQSKSHFSFDGHWLYTECKKVDGIPNVPGTYPRVALKIVQTQGMEVKSCLRRLFRRNLSLTYKISGYYRVEPDSDLNLIKQIIFQYGSIMAACPWYNSWSGVTDTFPEPVGKTGGHAFRIIGWDKVGFVVANSWGTEWGKKGVATMPYYMFFTDVLPNGDVWKVIDS